MEKQIGSNRFSLVKRNAVYLVPFNMPSVDMYTDHAKD